jgi:hydrogenase large subunit
MAMATTEPKAMRISPLGRVEGDLDLRVEVVRRFAPFTGSAYEKGVTLSGKPVEVYAIFGGQWPHSSFMVPGGVMCGPTLSDVTRATAILDHWQREWLEKEWLGCSVDRWLENRTWADVLAWADENDAQRMSDCGLFLRFARAIGLDRIGQGYGRYLAMGTYLDPELYDRPTIEGRNAALVNRAGIYDGGQFHDFDQALVRESTAHSFYRGDTYLHPWQGVTEPIDPADGHKQGKYSWAKSPRYELPGQAGTPLETGPLARQVNAGRPGAAAHQDFDPLFLDAVRQADPADPVEMGHVARSYDSCLVCTVHAYDGKTGRELAAFRLGAGG